MAKLTDKQRRIQNRKICRAAMLTLPDKRWTLAMLMVPFRELTPGEVRESDLEEALKSNQSFGFVATTYNPMIEEQEHQLTPHGTAMATQED